jgi:glycosyltransferase involved in cell wall biosynthesis
VVLDLGAVPDATLQPLRILIFYETAYPASMGGIEMRNFELASALARQGHEVTLAAFGPAEPAPTEPALRRLSLGPAACLYNRAGRRSAGQALRFALAAARIDLRPFAVVETAQVPFAHLFPLALRCRLSRRPLVVTWYEVWGAYWKHYVGGLEAPAHRAVEWLGAQIGMAATAPSELTARRLARVRRTGAAVPIACGVDVARVRGTAGSGRVGGGPPLVFAGRLLAHKRLDLLLRAVRELDGVVCDGPLLTVFGDGPDRSRLERLAAELGIVGRVQFRGHVATSEEVWESLGRARVAVQPSAREGFGLFPLEAMAAGLPVVFCDSSESAVGELVRDDVEGLSAAPEPTALAGAIARLLADRTLHERLRRAALRRAEEYDWDTVARRFEELCRQLLAGRL